MAIKFGDNLKRIRSEKNISQGDLAGMIGMHATHISRYERNISLPSIEVLKKMSEKLGVTADLLIYGPQGEKAKSNLQDNELLSMFTRVQALNKTELGCVKSLLSAYIFQKDTEQRLTKV